MNRCAVIGLGKAGFSYDNRASKETYSHSKAYFELSETVLVAASDIEKNKIETFKKTYDISVYNSYLEMMQNEKIDIISICSPNETHTKILGDLIKFKIKCIFCEKPISNNLDDLKNIFKEYKKKNVPIFVNYFRRWDSQFIDIKNSILKNEYQNIEIINIKYSKGLVHTGTHYLDFLIDWFGQPVKWTKPKLVEKFRNDDYTSSFSIYFRIFDKDIKVNMIGQKKNFESDEIIIDFKNLKIEILEARKINFYKKNNDGDKLIKSKSTEFNYIIKKIISDISSKIKNSNTNVINDNSKDSFDVLVYAKLINKSFFDK